MGELVQVCREVRECCYARFCHNCKHSVKGFPQCQDHLYAEKLLKNGEKIIKILKGEGE